MPKEKQDGQLGEARELPQGVKLLGALEGHENRVYNVAFDPTGQTLASGSSDKMVNLWDVASGKLLRTLEGHTSH
jgi:WD40 repeat protein